jgi:hypothetical protein
MRQYGNLERVSEALATGLDPARLFAIWERNTA